MTTLGVIGLGRIGAFHTDTLSGLDNIDGFWAVLHGMGVLEQRAAA